MGKVKEVYTEMCIEAWDSGYVAGYKGYKLKLIPHRFDELKDYRDAYKDGYREAISDRRRYRYG